MTERENLRRILHIDTLTRAYTLSQSTDAEEEIRKAAFACLKRSEIKKKVRLVGVRASHLERTL